MATACCLDVECLALFMEFSGLQTAAALSMVCRALSASVSAEDFWRQACDNYRFEDTDCEGLESGSWRVNFSNYGSTWARCERRQRLQAALEARGMILRSDSELCCRYIESGETPVDGVDGIVDTMCEMSFYFKDTSYAFERNRLLEEILERAHTDAVDAFMACEDSSVCVHAYLEQPERPVISEVAKLRALWRYAQEIVLHDRPRITNRIADAPHTLRVRLKDLCDQALRGANGNDVLERLQQTFHTSLDVTVRAEDPVTRRSRLRARYCGERQRIEASLASHIDALRRVATDESHTVHEFPPSLSRDERVFLHELAEQLDLQHESTGQGSERCLVVRRVAA